MHWTLSDWQKKKIEKVSPHTQLLSQLRGLSMAMFTQQVKVAQI